MQNDPEIAQSSAAGKTILQKFVDTRVRKKKTKILIHQVDGKIYKQE